MKAGSEMRVIMFVFQENVINECQNLDKPVGKIRLFIRAQGYKKLFAVSLYSFRRVVKFALNLSRVSSPSFCINIIHNYLQI